MADKEVTGKIVFDVDDAWLNLRREPIIEPDLEIVDPHHHLWDMPGSRYFFDNLLDDTSSGHNIRSSVFLQCGSMYRADGPVEMRPVGETEFANGVAAMAASGRYGSQRLCLGIIGWADLLQGARVEPLLEAHIRAAGSRFKGIRRHAAWDPDPSFSLDGYLPGTLPTHKGMLADALFREGMSKLAPLNLVFDGLVYFHQLPELIDLARAFPDTTIITNHCGGLINVGAYAGKDAEILPVWAKDITELGKCPNVYMKLGGLASLSRGLGFDGQNPASSEDLAEAWRPYFETCISAFGPSRCMFESNFPVDKVSCSYHVLWNAFKCVTSSYSTEEKKALYSQSAIDAYSLPLI